MVTNEINLFGLARVKAGVRRKKIYRVRDYPIMTLDEDQNIFLVTSVILSLYRLTNYPKTCYEIDTDNVQG